MNEVIIIADYHNSKHCTDIIQLMNHYAQDPMGGGMPLPTFTQDNLCQRLATIPHALTLLCYIEQQAIGLINSFEHFSTFKCQPIINIHDIVVIKEQRYQGVCQKMLEKLEAIAVKKGCCRLTLEVLEGNRAAQRAYQKYGFKGYELNPSMGHALFWEKTLT